ncbi:unnamed protein product [Nezara viridula]|uniref:Uncharacterized protein n=1 Tax=Nezara viridula TaxID=85310 RepID=A0A9P0MNR7_NEZVI|nr:unnamed protein product [Nezara viridula]
MRDSTFWKSRDAQRDAATPYNLRPVLTDIPASGLDNLFILVQSRYKFVLVYTICTSGKWRYKVQVPTVRFGRSGVISSSSVSKGLSDNGIKIGGVVWLALVASSPVQPDCPVHFLSNVDRIGSRINYANVETALRKEAFPAKLTSHPVRAYLYYFSLGTASPRRVNL